MRAVGARAKELKVNKLKINEDFVFVANVVFNVK